MAGDTLWSDHNKEFAFWTLLRQRIMISNHHESFLFTVFLTFRQFICLYHEIFLYIFSDYDALV